jgi:hypothetical protein
LKKERLDSSCQNSCQPADAKNCCKISLPSLEHLIGRGDIDSCISC